MTDVIRGPKDKDQFRDDPDNWVGYIDPLPACDLGQPFDTPVDSVSEKKKAWPKGFLTQWMVEQAATCAVDLGTEWQHLDRDDAIAWIAAASDRQRDAAADRGHEVHRLLETLLEGGNFDGLLEVNDATAYLDTLRLIVDKEQPELVASEVIVYGRWADPFDVVHEWMGTFDAVWKINGELVKVDYKSRKLGKAASRYPEEGAQVGGYSMGTYWIVEDDTGLHRMAPLDITEGLILSIAPDGYRKYRIADIEQARTAWKHTLMFHANQKTARAMFARAVGHNIEGGGTDNPPGQGTAVRSGASGVVGSVDDTDDIAAAPVTSPAGTVSSPAGDAIAHEARTAWLINRTNSNVERLTAQHVAQVWPTDLPRPKAIKAGDAVWTDADIDLIARALDALEAKHDVPFGDTDPKVIAERRAEAAAQAAKEARRERDRFQTVKPSMPEPVADDDAVQRLTDIAVAMSTSPDRVERERIARVSLWQRNANSTNPWRTRQGPGGTTPERVYSILAAAIAVSEHIDLGADDPDAKVRALLEAVIGDDAAKPANSIGALLGSLTIAQADELADLSNTNTNQKADTP